MGSAINGHRRWSALALIVTAQFMVILDVAIVNVALPSIKADLGFSQESLQWVVSAYAIFFGGTLLLGGRLADLLGRRRLFMVGVAVFSVSSLLSGLAWSSGSLIVFRGLQGIGREPTRITKSFRYARLVLFLEILENCPNTCNQRAKDQHNFGYRLKSIQQLL